MIPWMHNFNLETFVTQSLPAAVHAVDLEFSRMANNAWEGVDWVQRRVSVLTRDHLSPVAQRVLSAAIQAFPYLAIYLLLPAPLSVCAYIGLYVYQVRTQSHHMNDLYNGIGFAATLSGLDAAVTGILCVNPTRIVTAIAKIFFATLMFRHSGLIEPEGHSGGASGTPT